MRTWPEATTIVLAENRRARAEQARAIIEKFNLQGYNPENKNDQLYLQQLESDWRYENQKEVWKMNGCRPESRPSRTNQGHAETSADRIGYSS